MVTNVGSTGRLRSESAIREVRREYSMESREVQAFGRNPVVDGCGSKPCALLIECFELVGTLNQPVAPSGCNIFYPINGAGGPLDINHN